MILYTSCYLEITIFSTNNIEIIYINATKYLVFIEIF